MTKRSIATPAPSATLVIVRDAAAGIEVFLQQRHPNIPFLGGSYVFPGGKLELADYDSHWETISAISGQFAENELDSRKNALAYWIAAVRECHEESGILFAEFNSGEALNLAAFQPWPPAHTSVENNYFLAFCKQHSLRLATDKLIYLSHWITPIHLPKRFDTRFFIARCPENQTGSHDGNESVDSIWITPAAALERYELGQMSLIMPTLYTLKFMLGINNVAALISKAQNNRPTPANLPIFSNNRLLLPGDPGYDEAVAVL